MALEEGLASRRSLSALSSPLSTHPPLTTDDGAAHGGRRYVRRCR